MSNLVEKARFEKVLEKNSMKPKMDLVTKYLTDKKSYDTNMLLDNYFIILNKTDIDNDIVIKIIGIILQYEMFNKILQSEYFIEYL